MRKMNVGVIAPSEDLKRERLMQDYEQLDKETDFMRKKLEMMKRRRLVLMAEVRFLRKRLKYLSNHQVLVSGNHSNVGKKKQTRKVVGRTAVSCSDMNKKSNVICNERKPESKPNGIPGFAQGQMVVNVEKEKLRNSVRLPDLNEVEQTGTGDRKTSGRVPVFDLNKISREEEEVQIESEQMAMEDTKNSLEKAGSDELQNDVNLLGCKRIENGLKKAGKRKVSWQDQVVLRV